MANAPHALRVELKNLLADQLSSAELETLISELDIKDLPVRPTQGLTAQEVIGYLDRRNKIGLLAEAGPSVRDDLPWGEILGRYGYAAVSPAVKPQAPTVSYLDMQELVAILAAHTDFETPDGRRGLLEYAGVDRFIQVDLNGTPQKVANAVLQALKNYGPTPEGDLAIARLLKTLLKLQPTNEQRSILTEIITRYGMG